MNPIYWFWLLIFPPQLKNMQRLLSENQERIYLHLDKSDCIAGDTVWYKAYVTADRLPYVPSTVYYVDLFTEAGKLLRDDKCILIDGVGVGQIKLPDTLKSGNYFIRAHTYYQYMHDSTTSLYTPIVVYNAASYQNIRHYAYQRPRTDTIDQYDRGVHLFTTPLDSGIECNITASYPFNRWDRQLTLELKAGKQAPTEIPITITREHPRQHVHVLLHGVYGNMYLKLTDQRSILSQEVINVPYESPDSVTIHYDTLSTAAQGRNVWHVTIKDTSLVNVSVSVTDADKVQPQAVNILDAASALDTVKWAEPSRLFASDCQYLELNGIASTEKGGPLKVREVSAIIGQDSSNDMAISFPIHGDGSYSYKDFIFIDSFHIDFQRNNHKWNMDDVKLRIVNKQVPVFTRPKYFELADSLTYKEDTSVIFREDSIYHQPKGFNQMHELKTIVIKVNKYKAWDDWRHKLNDKYCPGTMITPWFFDLVHEDVDQYATTIVEYLSRNCSGFTYDIAAPIPSPKIMGNYAYIFINGQQVQNWQLMTSQLKDVAFIKVDNDYWGPVDTFEKTFQEMIDANKSNMQKQIEAARDPSPPKPKGSSSPPLMKLTGSSGPDGHYAAIMIYTRHPEDWKFRPSNMHELQLPGYAKILHFNPGGDKRWTMLWVPGVQQNDFTIRFANNGYTKHFRVTIEGIDQKGDFIHYEEVIPAQHD